MSQFLIDVTLVCDELTRREREVLQLIAGGTGDDAMTMRIPITIITGFLGAGKTTLLNRLLRAEHGLRLAVLVNDFGSVNIDAQLIIGIEGETISLKNGCICCTIRDDLREAVLRLLAREDAPDAIVIETSGVSDPYAVAATFTLSADLRERTQVDCIVALVDAEQVTDLSGELFGLAVDLVSAADLVVLNKLDLVSERQRENARGWVMGFAPKVSFVPARMNRDRRCCMWWASVAH